MKIILAEHFGICFGVRDAIAAAEQLAEQGPLTILGELVHNPVVRERLAARGVLEGNAPSLPGVARGNEGTLPSITRASPKSCSCSSGGVKRCRRLSRSIARLAEL